MIIYHFNANDDNLITKYATDQWEFQDPKMEVPYYIRPYFVGMFPYIGQKHRPYKWKVPPIHRFLLHGHWTDHDDQQLINPQSNQALGPWLHPFPRDAHRGCTPVGGSSKMSKMMGYNISHHAWLWGTKTWLLGRWKAAIFGQKPCPFFIASPVQPGQSPQDSWVKSLPRGKTHGAPNKQWHQGNFILHFAHKTWATCNVPTIGPGLSPGGGLSWMGIEYGCFYDVSMPQS
jgi:hypothetical protein